ERIDVWWGGLKGNGGLMMLLAYLIRTDLSWRGAVVRLKMVVANESAAEDARANVTALLAETRTGAELDVIAAHGRPFVDILYESSHNADLVFMGMAEPNDDYVSYYEQLRKRTEGLPTTVFVLAAEEIAFDEVLL
ncbi:MAG: Na-K-Cl cotransporter, partial [Rhodothermales bacterium]